MAGPRALGRILGAGLLVGAALLGGGARAGGDPEVPARLDLVVHGDPGHEERAAWARDVVPRIDEEVALLLGCPRARGRVSVYFVDGIARMREVAQAQIPAWAAGLCSAARGLVVVRVDIADRPPFRSVGSVVRHEWVHLLLGQASEGSARILPLWFEEGIAERVGGGVSVDGGARLDLAVVAGTLLPLSELEHAFPSDARRADLAYQQGRSFVDGLIHQAGWEGLRSLLRRLRASRGDPPCSSPMDCLDRALLEETGQRLGAWEAWWKERLIDQARPWFHLVLRDVGWSLIVLAALGAAVAFYFVRRRRKAELEALPRE